MNEIPESELWECSTCKQPHPLETDYECASCGMLASEHISVTAMCRIIREWQSRAYSAELKLARIERERDRLAEALRAITYKNGDRYFSGVHDDSDVTDKVGPALAAVKPQPPTM
jgi:hypothetical protein